MKFPNAPTGPMNPFDMNAPMKHTIHGLPNVGQSQHPPLGVHGPWNLNPGSPNFPNHHPYMTHIKPENIAAPTPSQKLKMPS